MSTRAAAILLMMTAALGCGRDAPAPRAEAPALPAPAGMRLPDGVAPLAYRAAFEVDPARETFRGRVEIDVQLDRATAVLWLDAHELTIRSATERRGDVTRVLTPHAQDPLLGLTVAGDFAPGAFTLILEYDGVQTAEQGNGLRRKEDRGDWYIVTQHEAQGARRALPCFDDPRHKVPFTIELIVPAGMMALSNSPAIADEALPDDRHRVRFAPTPPIPSYLLALAVGPFEAVDAGTSRHGVPMRIIVPHGRGGAAAYVAAETPKLLAALEDYTGIPYPYAKLDQIVVPGAPRGAMENPGLITYAPRLLLIPDGESAAVRRSALEVIAHELAHQWFGNLVTMDWWDDVWLNEAFASWAEPWVLDAVHPELQGEALIGQDRRTALAADALTSARRIRQPVEDKAALGAAFDGITYQKGATVLHMFEQWLGHDTFRDGVRVYLNRFAWKHASASDFLAALSEAAGKDVGAAMSTFLDQAGAPLISIERICRGKASVARLTQGRFLTRGATPPKAATSWQVPVCLRTSDDPTLRCAVVGATAAEIPLGATCPAWLVPAAGRGHHVTALDEALERALAKDVARLSTGEQIAYLGDLGSLVDGGQRTLPVLLDLMQPLGASRTPQLAELVTARLAGLMSMVEDADRDAFAQLVKRAVGAAATRVGWAPHPGEDFVDAGLREDVMPLVAISGADPQAADQAAALTGRWLADHDAVSRSLWSKVLTTAVRSRPDAVFEPLLARLADEPDVAARRAILGALAAVEDPARYQRALGLLLDGDTVPGERLALLAASTPATAVVAFAFVRDNLAGLRRKFTENWHDRFAVTACDAALRDEVARFLATELASVASVGELGVRQATEEMDACIAARTALAPELASYLRR